MEKKKLIAITGTSGYLGNYLLRLLYLKGCNVCEVGRRRSNFGKECGIEFRRFNLKKEAPTNLMKNITTLIHTAYDFSETSFKKIKQTNVLGTQRIFSNAEENFVNKIILISSISAYKKNRSNYGKSKYLQEKVTKKYKPIIVRPGLIYGDSDKGIISSLKKISQLPIIPIIGSGKQIIHTTYIEDLCNYIFEIIKDDNNCQKESSREFTIISNKGISFKNLIFSLRNQNKNSPLFIHLPFWIIYYPLRLLELFKIKLPLRADSVLSLHCLQETKKKNLKN